MVPIVKASLCRFSQAAHYKSGHRAPASSNRNFMRETPPAILVCVASRPWGETTWRSPRYGFRAIMRPKERQLVQGQHRAMRAILAVVLLCTAFTLGKARAEPSEETIARGKALTETAGCASCHTADPSKPFAGGRRIDTPFGAIYSSNLTPDRDTGLGAWTDGEFHRALRYGVAPDGSLY